MLPIMFLLELIQTANGMNANLPVIQLTDEWKATMQKRLEAITAFKEDYSFYSHTYSDLG